MVRRGPSASAGVLQVAHLRGTAVGEGEGAVSTHQTPGQCPLLVHVFPPPQHLGVPHPLSSHVPRTHEVTAASGSRVGLTFRLGCLWGSLTLLANERDPRAGDARGDVDDDVMIRS